MPWYETLVRLGLAVLFGMIIGFEREHRHRPAGVKTHILVCVGAALVSLIQVQMINETIRMIQQDALLAQALKSDYGRMGAQVISGIGFLGAGTILHNKGTIKGLTTAATLWLTACVGLAVGMGYYWMSGLTVLLTMTVLVILHLIQNSLAKTKGLKHLEVTMSDKRRAMAFINDFCVLRDIAILSMEFVEYGQDEENKAGSQTYVYTLRLPRSISAAGMVLQWQMNPDIVAAVLMEPEAG